VTLADRFMAEQTKSIEVDGQTVWAAFDLEAESDLEVRIESSAPLEQAMLIRAVQGELVMAGVRGNRFNIDPSTAPMQTWMAIELDGATTVRFWNRWRTSAPEGWVEWVGNAGMLVDRRGDEFEVRCSSGIGAVSFDDLVVRFRALKNRRHAA
jgi:hypothetical protein